MPIIQTEIWKDNQDRPGTVIFDSQRTAQDIFSELEAHLAEIGRMPDEYFLLWVDWKDGKLFPKDATLSCVVNYGSSEGIYLDISIAYEKDVYEYSRKTGELGWHKRQVIERFATGKTLGESNGDLDRMNLTASSVTAAFYGYENGVHARYAIVERGETQTDFAFDVAPHNEKYAELVARLNKNIDDYHDLLMGLGRRDIIDMAGKIAAMSDTRDYMHRHDYTESELDYFLQFKNPLELVADIWQERELDDEEISFALDYAYEHRGDIITEHPLTDSASAALESSPRRYMGVDLISFLDKISEKVNTCHPDDWTKDKEGLYLAAKSQDPNKKRLIWHVCSYGTHLQQEYEAFIKGSIAYGCMTGYRQNDPDMFGYVIEVTGFNGGSVIGNVFEVSIYADYAKHICDMADPLDSLTIIYSGELGGEDAGKTVTVSRDKFVSDGYRLICESGKVASLIWHPQDKARLADILNSEYSRHMSLPVGSQEVLLRKLTEKLSEIRKPQTALPEQTENPAAAKPKQSILARLAEAGAEATAHNEQMSKSGTVKTKNHNMGIG